MLAAGKWNSIPYSRTNGGERVAGPCRRPYVGRQGLGSLRNVECACRGSEPHRIGALVECARAATIHRLLSVLKRRGYVRQDDNTARYRLTLKVLDLGFRQLGRSELKLHAYPVLREYALRTGTHCFIAAPAAGEVTYVWGAGPDEVAMHTAYGREMPGHCALYFDEARAMRRLSCLRLVKRDDVEQSGEAVVRLRPKEGLDSG